MSDELPSSPSDIFSDVFYLGLRHYFFVGDSVLLAYRTCKNTSVLLLSLLNLSTFHVSQPYIKTGLFGLILVRRLMLVRQIFLNVIDTALALTTLLWMSCVPPPSLETVALKYTNLSTSFIIIVPYLYSTISIVIQ